MKKKTANKVLMLTLFPHRGNGSSTVVHALASQMSRTHDVQVFYVGRESADPGNYPVHFMLVDSFPVLRTHPLSLDRRQFIDLSQDEINQYLNNFYVNVSDLARRFDPDVIHVHHGWLGAAVAARIRRETGIPYIVQFHGTELEVLSDYRRASEENFLHLEKLNCDGLRDASRIVAISPTQRRLVETYLKRMNLPSKVEMVLNGYDEEIFHPGKRYFSYVRERFSSKFSEGGPDEGMPVVLFVGRFAGFKGVEHLVRAAKIYGEKGIQTWLCGDGELHGDMVRLSRDLGVKHIHFLDHVDHFEDLPVLYNIADVLAVPSRDEPFGLVAIEAMGCGTPLVASNSGALPFILGFDGPAPGKGEFAMTKHGAVVPFGDPEAIAKAVEGCVENDFKGKSRDGTVDYARKTFSVKTQCEGYERLYDEAIESNQS